MIGKMYEARKHSHGGDRKSNTQSGNLKKGQNRTAKAIANEMGCRQLTIEHAGKFSKGIDALREVSPAAEKV